MDWIDSYTIQHWVIQETTDSVNSLAPNGYQVITSIYADV